MLKSRPKWTFNGLVGSLLPYLEAIICNDTGCELVG